MKTKLLNPKNNFTAVQAVSRTAATTATSTVDAAKLATLAVKAEPSKNTNVSTTAGITVSQCKNSTAETIVIPRTGTGATDFKNFANSLSKATTGTHKPAGGKTHYVTFVYWNDSKNRTSLSSFIAAKLPQYNDRYAVKHEKYIYLADTNGNKREQQRRNLKNWCNFLKKAYNEFANLPPIQTSDPAGQTFYITDGFRQIQVEIPFSAEKAIEELCNSETKKIINSYGDSYGDSGNDTSDNKVLKYGAVAFIALFVVLIVVKLVKKRRV